MVAGLSNKVAIIIQARISSNRLTGKIALDLCGKTILERVVDQCRISKFGSDIIIATSTENSDNITEEIGRQLGVKVFRGSLLDVRSRYLEAGKGYTYIVRVTADNPFTETSYIVRSIEKIKSGRYDYISVSNCPYGSGVQTFKYDLLEYLSKLYSDNNNYEHVLLEAILRENNEINTGTVDGGYIGSEKLRLTVDTCDDYIKAFRIVLELKRRKIDINIDNIIAICDKLYKG